VFAANGAEKVQIFWGAEGRMLDRKPDRRGGRPAAERKGADSHKAAKFTRILTTDYTDTTDEDSDSKTLGSVPFSLSGFAEIDGLGEVPGTVVLLFDG
jgi:hypothetical protein